MDRFPSAIALDPEILAAANFDMATITLPASAA